MTASSSAAPFRPFRAPSAASAIKLDRGHGPEREPVDREVEARVHHREYRAPRRGQAEVARLTNAELGRRVNLSAPAVADRIRRLERRGVLTGYRAEIDPKALGLTLGAIIRIRPSPGQLPKVADLARDTPEVVECPRITGEDCSFMKLHVRDIAHLEEVLDRFIIYGQTTTSIIQSSPVALRALFLAQEGHPRRADAHRAKDP